MLVLLRMRSFVEKECLRFMSLIVSYNLKMSVAAVWVWLRFPHLGRQGESLVKTLIRKLQCNPKEQVKFIVFYKTKKVSYFFPKKDKIPILDNSILIYEVTCPGCFKSYIDKTNRTLLTRLNKHAKSNTNKSAIRNHLTNCHDTQHITDIFRLYDTIKVLISQFIIF